MHPRTTSKSEEESKDSISPKIGVSTPEEEQASTNLSDQPTIKQQAETSPYFEINSTTPLEDIENNEKDVKLLNATIDQVKLIINKRCLISAETPSEILAALSSTNLLCIESDISNVQIEKLPNHLNNVLICNINFPAAQLSKFKDNFSRFCFENIPESKLQSYITHLPDHVRVIVLNEYSLGINKALSEKKNIDQLIIGKISTISDLTPTIFSLSVWKNVSTETLKSIPDSIKYLIILDELSDEKLTAIPSHVVLYGSYFTSDTIKNLPENIKKLYAMPCVEQAIKLNCLPESIDTLFIDKKTNCELLKNLPAQIRQIMFRDINVKTQIPVIASHIRLIYDQTQSYNQEIMQAISERNSTINISNAKDNKSSSVIINNNIQKQCLKQDEQKDTAKTKDKELEQKKTTLLARFQACCNHYKKPKFYNFKKLDDIVIVSEKNVSISLESYEKDIQDQLKSDKNYVKYREKLDDSYINVKASITKIEDIRNNIGTLEYKLKTQIEVETDKIKNDLEINNFESAENRITAIERLNNNLDLEIKNLNVNFETIESKTKKLTEASAALMNCINATIRKLNALKTKEEINLKQKKGNKVNEKGKDKEKPSISTASSSSIPVSTKIDLKNTQKSVKRGNEVSEKEKKIQPISTSSASSSSASTNEGLNHQASDYIHKRPTSKTLWHHLPNSLRELVKNSKNDKDRIVTSYESNLSSSVSYNKNLPEAIEHHARSRVDLFFLLLMACYNTHKKLSLSKTVLQHGKGNKQSGTQAAHRSIFPSLIDTSNGKTFIKGTHLYTELNATDELPEYVNKFDDILESRRDHYLNIINDVSKGGGLNPVEGLHSFLIDLKEVLLSPKTKQSYLSHLINSKVKYEEEEVNNVILNSLMGTTKNIIDSTNSINTVYTDYFLGINEDDRKILRINDPIKENEVYQKKCEEFQKSLKVAKRINYLETKFRNERENRKSDKDKWLKNIIQESPVEDIEEFKNNDSESSISLPAQSNDSGIIPAKPKTLLEDRVSRLGFILHLTDDDNINHENYIYSLAILSEISRIIVLYDPKNYNIFPLLADQAKEFLNNINSNPLLFMDEEKSSTKSYHLSILNDKNAFENLGWGIFNYFEYILKSASARNKDPFLVSRLENNISMLPLFKRLINKDSINKCDALSKQKIVDDNIELFYHLMGMRTCSADVLYPAIGFLAARVSSLAQGMDLIPHLKKIAVAYRESHDYFNEIHEVITSQEYLKYTLPKNILIAKEQTKQCEPSLKDESKSSEIAKKEVNSCDEQNSPLGNSAPIEIKPINAEFKEVLPQFDNMLKPEDIVLKIKTVFDDFNKTQTEDRKFRSVFRTLCLIVRDMREFTSHPHDIDLQASFMKVILEEKKAWMSLDMANEENIKLCHSGGNVRMISFLDTLAELLLYYIESLEYTSPKNILTAKEQTQQSIIKHNISLCEYPNIDYKKANPKEHLFIGDLHGNTLKLIQFLLCARVITMNPQDYEELATFYYEPVNWLDDNDIYKNKLQQACRLIDKITRVYDCGFVHLIGNEVGDRGQNDYLTLYLIARLIKIGVELDILYSKHGLEFLHAMQQLSLYNKIIDHKVFLSDSSQKCSLVNMLHLIENKKIEWKEVHDLVTQYYIPRLNVLNYTFSADCKRFTLVSHAPIGIETVYKLANNFQINYQDKTVFELALTIDQINQVFRTLIRNKQLAILILPREAAFDEHGFVNMHYPTLEVIWNRKNVNRPIKINNFFMTYVHGHDDSCFGEPPVYINLDKDNLLGKFPEAKSGNLNFYINHELMLNPTSNDIAYKKYLAYLFQQAVHQSSLPSTSPTLFNFNFVDLFEDKIELLIRQACSDNHPSFESLKVLKICIDSIKSDRDKITITLDKELFDWVFSQSFYNRDLSKKDKNGNNFLHRLFDFADAKYVIPYLEAHNGYCLDLKVKGKENLSILGLSVAQNKPEITTHLLKNYADHIEREDIAAMHEKAKSIPELNKTLSLFENLLNPENSFTKIKLHARKFYDNLGSLNGSARILLSLYRIIDLTLKYEPEFNEKLLQASASLREQILIEKYIWEQSDPSKSNEENVYSTKMCEFFDELIQHILDTQKEIPKKEKNTLESDETISSSKNRVKCSEAFKEIVSHLKKFYSASVTEGSSECARLSLENLLSFAKQCETQPQEKDLQESFIREILKEKNKWANLPTIYSPKFYDSSPNRRMEKLLDELIEFFDLTIVNNMRNSFPDLTNVHWGQP